MTTYIILIEAVSISGPSPTFYTRLGEALLTAYQLSYGRECTVLDENTGAIMAIYQDGDLKYFDPDPYLGYW